VEHIYTAVGTYIYHQASKGQQHVSDGSLFCNDADGSYYIIYTYIYIF